MKKSYFFLFGLFMALQSFITADDRIRFNDSSLSNVYREAKSEDKMVFIMITSEYCGVCRKMEGVLTNSEVGKFYNSNFVNTRMDPQNTMDNLRASNWGITQVPAMVFLNSNRKVVHKVIGYRDAQAMLNEAKLAMRKNR